MMSRDQVQRTMRAAWRDSDRLAIECLYCDADGNVSLRKCSPIRQMQGSWMVMCLSAGEPRRFLLDGIYAAWVIKAADCLVPERKVVMG